MIDNIYIAGGTDPTDWTDPGNWSLGHAPTSSERAVFDAAHGFPAEPVSPVTVGSVHIADGGGGEIDLLGVTCLGTLTASNSGLIDIEDVGSFAATCGLRKQPHRHDHRSRRERRVNQH